MEQPDKTPVEYASQAQLGSFLLVYEAWCHVNVAKSEIAWFQWLTNTVSSEKILNRPKLPLKAHWIDAGRPRTLFWQMRNVHCHPWARTYAFWTKLFDSPVFCKSQTLYPKIEIRTQMGTRATNHNQLKYCANSAQAVSPEWKIPTRFYTLW